jgi:hypothetical protein
MAAASKDYAEIVTTLIIQGARADMVDTYGETALMMAEKYNHINSVAILRTGLDPLQRTCQRRDEEVGIMIVYGMFTRRNMSFDLARRISSFDYDPTLEYLSQKSLLRLKESVTRRQAPLPTSDSSLTRNSAFFSNYFDGETKEHKEEIERSNVLRSSHASPQATIPDVEAVIFRISPSSSVPSSSSVFDAPTIAVPNASLAPVAPAVTPTPLTAEERREHQNAALTKRKL